MFTPTTMPRRILDTDDEENLQPQQQKKPRRTGDDLSGNVQFPERTRKTTQRNPSAKQAAIGTCSALSSLASPIDFFNAFIKDKENIATIKAKMARLEKEMVKARRAQKDKSTCFSRASCRYDIEISMSTENDDEEDSGDGPESEEDNGSEEDTSIAFSSSVL